MKKSATLILITSITMSTFSASNIAVEAMTTSSHSNKDYLISFKKNIDSNIIKKYKGTILEQYKNFSFVKASFDYNPTKELLKDRNILSVEEDILLKNQNLTTANLFSTNNYLISTKNSTLTLTGKGSSVAILDTGVSTKHKDLKIKGGISFIEGNKKYEDDNGHGTHLAGIIGAQKNKIGITGIAPNADIYAVKVLDNKASGKYSTVVKGIDWAIEKNIDVILMSLGGLTESTFFKKAIDKAYKKGSLLVSSAGNYGYKEGNTITYPAKYNSTIAVGALDSNNERGYLSSKGSQLELMAPGVDIQSTWIKNSYKRESGTSMAAAYVAGEAALLFGKYPKLKNKEIRHYLKSSASPLGKHNEYGNGKINLNKAIQLIESNQK